MNNKNDILIPLAKSDIGYDDLRYALRLIERNVRDYRDIWIIGEKPDWIQNVVHLHFPMPSGPEWKEKNIWDKVMYGCGKDGLSENFLFTNDDIFITKPIEADNYPFYYKGSCYESMKINKGKYRATMNHTKNLLERRGFKDMNADIHTPIIYNKTEFLNTFEPEHFETKWGYGIKSLYCAFNRKDMTFMDDCKIGKKHSKEEIHEMVKDRHVFSCTDVGFKYGIKEYLEELYPEKSKYES